MSSAKPMSSISSASSSTTRAQLAEVERAAAEVVERAARAWRRRRRRRARARGSGARSAGRRRSAGRARRARGRSGGSPRRPGSRARGWARARAPAGAVPPGARRCSTAARTPRSCRCRWRPARRGRARRAAAGSPRAGSASAPRSRARSAPAAARPQREVGKRGHRTSTFRTAVSIHGGRHVVLSASASQRSWGPAICPPPCFGMCCALHRRCDHRRRCRRPDVCADRRRPRPRGAAHRPRQQGGQEDPDVRWWPLQLHQHVHGPGQLLLAEPAFLQVGPGPLHPVGLHRHGQRARRALPREEAGPAVLRQQVQGHPRDAPGGVPSGPASICA